MSVAPDCDDEDSGLDEAEADEELTEDELDDEELELEEVPAMHQTTMRSPTRSFQRWNYHRTRSVVPHQLRFRTRTMHFCG